MSDEFSKGEGLLDLASVQQAIADAAAWSGAEQARRSADTTRAFIAYNPRGVMESPLEAIFYAWFSALLDFEAPEVYLFNLIPQAEITLASGKTYRLDFSVEFGPQSLANAAHARGIPQPKVAIELDGHQFHERTKEQVAYRNERDRALTSEGWAVIHFSGSELYRDPLSCARHVVDFCKQKTAEWSVVVFGLK